MPGVPDRDHLVDVIARSRMAVFVGRNDTGKSTHIKRIAQSLDVSVIDADIGQSDIGPPTVVALGERRGDRYAMSDGYFCGSTTPAKHFLQLIAGASRMAGRVKKYPVLVNTTGLATGDIGRMLKTEKINALGADVIIGLGSGLAYLDAFARAGAAVVHLPVSPAVKQKGRVERASLRQRSFMEHFHGARTRTYPFNDFAIERSLLFNGERQETGDAVLRMDISDNEAIVVARHALSGVKGLMQNLNVDRLDVYTPDDFAGLLVGLVDGEGKFLSLGIVEAMDFEREEVRLYTPAKSFSVLQVGSIKLRMEDFSYAGAFSGTTFGRKHI